MTKNKNELNPMQKISGNKQIYEFPNKPIPDLDDLFLLSDEKSSSPSHQVKNITVQQIFNGFPKQDLQSVYDNSVYAEMKLSAGKPLVLEGQAAGFRTPSMSTSEFQSISSPLNGENAWSSDEDRPIFNTGSPLSPSYKRGAFLEDLPSVLSDASVGEMYFLGNVLGTSLLANTPAKIAGIYLNGELLGFTHSNGTLTYIGSPKLFSLSATVGINCSEFPANFNICLYKNGVQIEKSKTPVFVGGNIPSSIPVTAQCESSFSSGDTLEVYIENTTLTNFVVVSYLNCGISSIGGSTPGIDTTLQDAYNNGDGTILVTNPKPFQINFSGVPYSLRVASTVDAGVQLTNFGHGVPRVLGTSISPKSSYTNGVYELVWNTLLGTNTIVANSFQIGDTIEVDITGAFQGILTGGDGIIRVSMGSIFSVESQSITMNISGQRNFALKLKITRLDTTTITASCSGWYESQGDVMHPFRIFINPSSLPYNSSSSYSVNIEYKMTAPVGNSLYFLCKNLHIIQYT